MKKLYLALFCSIGLVLQTFVTAEDAYNIPQLLRQTEVTTPQPYTPFGNRMKFNRSGDDGSSCVLDSNGVLTWIDGNGVVRLLPDTSLAVPLFVTNTECLVWNNRFADFATYPNRPAASLKLFQASSGSTVVTSKTVSASGTEVLDTAPVTTAPLNFVTFTRRDNGNETWTPNSYVNLNDDCSIRIYRSSSDIVQLIKTLLLQVKSAPDFTTNVTGPDVSSIGYGSDGSIIIRVKDVFIAHAGDSGIYEDQTYWIDSQGRSVRVETPDPAPAAVTPITRVLFTSGSRLIYEDAAGLIREQRRSAFNGNVIGGAQLVTGVGVGETCLDLSNYSKVGSQEFFYTVDAPPLGTGMIVRTYLLGSECTLRSTAHLANPITPAAVVATMNPVDGSALVYEEGGASVIWLHSGSAGYSLLPDSSKAKPLFVTDSQAVSWDNALAPVGDNGAVPPAVVKHYSRDLITNAFTPANGTQVYVDGNTVFSTSRSTPALDYWLLTTAQKTSPEMSLLRFYRLNSIVTLTTSTLSNGSITGIATNGKYLTGTTAMVTAVPAAGYAFTGWTGDASGNANPLTVLMDANKTISATFSPDTNDSDADGLSNYEEIVILGTNPTMQDTDGDNVKDKDDAFPLNINEWLDTDGDGTGDNADTDDDGDSLSDEDEINNYGTDPKRTDSDGDGLSDPVELQVQLTNPNLADTDSDGLSDGAEVNTHLTNPKVGDTDGDGFLDGYEVLTGKSPLDILDKPALVAEARTAIEFTFPSALGKTYRIEDSPDLTTWGTVESGITGNGGQIQRFYTTRNHQKRFFRVEEDDP